MLPGYTMHEALTHGKQYTIYRGVRETDQLPVLIKLLKTSRPEPTEIAQLKREYDIIKSLDITGVVKALAFEIHQHQPALILEDMGGHPLAAYCTSNTLDFTRCLTAAIQIASTLEELHRHEMIHRDLNPQHIIVTLDPLCINLINFSLASRLPQETPTLVPPHLHEDTLAYISPEQTGRMNRAIDSRTDLYSFGVVLYEMLTGTLPFVSDDPLEWVHSHLAKQPMPPHHINADVPQVLSDIVMKLLAKTAESRYQSARGVEADLRFCLTQWQTSGAIQAFTPGLHDEIDRLQLPQKLYGRDADLAKLMVAFEQVSQGRAGLLLVSGHAGIGKSALVHEMHQPITAQRGYFIAGKFDQLQRTTPYRAISMALRDLMRQLLTESETQLAQWQHRILNALGANGRVMIDVIPEIEWIVGAQPPVAALTPHEAQNRLQLVFQRFMRVFCQPEHPLVMFLDDLQWADVASLNLLEWMLTDPDTRYLLVIGAYRDQEVMANHPFNVTLKHLQRHQAAVTHLALDTLHLDPIAQYLADTLHHRLATVQPLAELILRKTDGNPFFVRQFLQTLFQEHLLIFDAPSRAWQWDVDRIEAMNITTNVVELMLQKLQRLPASTQQILSLAACIGNRFDGQTLAMIRDQTPEAMFDDLLPALREGLVLATAHTYRFLHDRVQQAAYTVMDEAAKRAAHLKIGRQLMARLSEGERAERRFELADHLNTGRELIADAGEKIALAQLNLDAGIKARDASAYTAAKAYFIAGMTQLPDNMWDAHNTLALTLHRHLAEAEYLTGDFARSEELAQIVLLRAESPLDKAEMYHLLIVQHILLAQYPQALEAGRQALALLGHHLPTDHVDIVFDSEFAKSQRMLGDRDIAELIEAPEVDDPQTMVALKLLAYLFPLAIAADRALLPVLTVKTVNLSLEYGLTANPGYGGYGLLLCTRFGRYREGYAFGRLAMAVSDKFGNAVEKSRTSHTFIAFINHWSKPLADAVEINQEGYRAALEAGALDLAGYHCYDKAFLAYHRGQSLSELRDELTELRQFTEATRNQSATDIIIAVQFAVLSLTSQTPDPLTLTNGSLSGADFEEQCLAHQGIAALTYYRIFKLQLLYLYGAPQEALNYLTTIQETLFSIAGSFAVAVYNVFHSLILTALYPDMPSSNQAQYWKQLEINQQQLNTWAENCPENFWHKYLLVAAEIARLRGDDWEAGDLYDQAIRAAGEQGFVQDEALANELAAQFYLSKDRASIASVYVHEADYCYRTWGAMAKVQHSPSPETPTAEDALDLITVTQSLQAIASELALDELRGKVVSTIMANAGARKGILMLAKHGQLFIEAECAVDAPSTNAPHMQPVDIEGGVPLSIISYVKRTRESLVLTDAKHDHPFAHDPYMIQQHPKSILCTPILHQGQLIGVMYLEHDLLTDAFTPARIELVQI
ncbi:MAG: hypothetical protein ETSY1_32885 [Candidatus Entotheonella factor]|uniref:Protein kinase domain-containing protein n=1 Tax=Entotheonella factor TaxID=1429438 RepID=W4LAF7_ENTF1|nr:MAG: hypothetical protein ETSY1_32885 [Candidatus Entotheonella factor]